MGESMSKVGSLALLPLLDLAWNYAWAKQFRTFSAEIWAMPDRPEDLRRHASTVRTLRSRQLRIMMDDLMNMIESQKEIGRQLTRLTDVLQQDDPAYQDVDFEEDGIPADTVKDTLESAQVRACC